MIVNLARPLIQTVDPGAATRQIDARQQWESA
jgi:hypothetical protein